MRVITALLLCSLFLKAAPPALPPLREQTDIQQSWLKLRLERNLPLLMRKQRVQMWIVACREYAEDPAFFPGSLSAEFE